MAVTGAVLYEGPSELDGEPIVVIATGLGRPSQNIKTGPMVQIWIMRRDIDPPTAKLIGADVSICGDCPHRDGTCYVIVVQAPRQIWKTYQEGGYADWTKAIPHNALEGSSVRYGAYGDPAAVPFKVWRRVRSQRLSSWTGYTQQWTKRRFRWLRNFLMASVDSKAAARAAQEAGWRTFRVRLAGEKLAGDTACPASEEGGLKVQCYRCGMCAGKASSAKSISILVHGNGTKRFTARKLELAT